MVSFFLGKFFYPFHQYGHGIALLFGCEGTARRNMVPLGEASSATAARGMLGDEDRMPPHGRLFSVVRDDSRSQPLAYEIGGMLPDGIHSFLADVGDVGRFQAEPASERGVGKPFKKVGEVVFRRRLRGGRRFRSFPLVKQIWKKTVHLYACFEFVG